MTRKEQDLIRARKGFDLALDRLRRYSESNFKDAEVESFLMRKLDQAHSLVKRTEEEPTCSR